MKGIDNEKNTIKGLTATIVNMYDVAFNTWADVKHNSISQMLEANGVAKRYVTHINEVLSEKGLFFKEGQTAAMRYKIVGERIPDFNDLAEAVFQKGKDSYKKLKQYKKSSDTSPKQSKKQKEFIKNGTPGITTIPVPNLGDTRYMMANGLITEVKVVELKDTSETDGSPYIKCTVTHRNSNEEVKFWHRYEIDHRQLYETPERLVQVLLMKISKNEKKISIK